MHATAGTGSTSSLRTFIEVLLWVVLPLTLFLPFLFFDFHRGILGVDFENFLLPAARAVAAGESPYPGYEYPPLVAFALVPFTWVPAPNIGFAVLMTGCVPASLWFFGVRDWRCYGVVLVWAPVFAGVQTSNVTLPLVLGCAICWHARDRWKTVALSGGLTVAAKLLTLPLVVWLVVTRRIKAAVGVGVVAGGVSLMLWSILGFSGMTEFPRRIGDIEKVVSPQSYTLKVVLEDAGIAAGSARLAWAVVALAVIAAAAFLGWRGDDRRSFALCMMAMIVGSPIVWLHSFAFLIGVVAVMRPRLGVAWLLPILLFIGPGTGNGAPWQTAGVLVIAFVTLGVALLPERDRVAVPDLAMPLNVVADRT
jgi:alpha-1,2-mannosyltransferase